MTDPMEILDRHFPGAEAVVCSWPGCTDGGGPPDQDGATWCDQHEDPEVFLDWGKGTGLAPCVQCDGMGLRRLVTGESLHHWCARHYALGRIHSDARGAYARSQETILSTVVD